MNFTDIKKSSLCLGCGVCTALDNNLSLIEKNGMREVNFIGLDNLGKITPTECCPALEPNLNELSKYKFKSSLSSEKIDMGIYNRIYLAASNNKEILKKSSSGGVITEIALYLLENDLVDGVICQIMEYSLFGPRPKSIIARNEEDLIKAQGSKYCPTSIDDALREAISKNERYCLIGLPCQINAVLKAEKHGLIKKNLIKYTIGNFCGGFKDYRELDDLIVRNGKNVSNVNHFQFRGDGQPGFLKISDGQNDDIKIKYPNYGAGSYVNKFDRCTLCIDATALLADFACGDAWLDEKSKKIDQGSLIISRSKNADLILKTMIEEKKIVAFESDENDVRISQKDNMYSKIFRQKKRRIIYKLFFQKVPDYDILLPKSKTSILYELKVYLGKIKLNVLYFFKITVGFRK